MKTIELMYLNKMTSVSDINQHLPVLFEYALKCSSIAEFGVRDVVSTYAFAHARPKKLICVDIFRSPNVDELEELCQKENIPLRFDVADTLSYNLEEVDFLFIDTLHTYSQLSRELALHHTKVKKYMAFHDTISFGHTNEDGSCTEKQGLVPAISEFLKTHREWREICTYTRNNGLTIIERIG